jgi:hypothetical protein
MRWLEKMSADSSIYSLACLPGRARARARVCVVGSNVAEVVPKRIVHLQKSQGDTLHIQYSMHDAAKNGGEAF